MIRKFRDIFIPVWGVAYLMAFFIRPGLISNIPVWTSAASLLLLFAVVIANFFIFDIDIVWYLLSLRAMFGMVASWTGLTVWNVPYDPGMAAVSMAILDLVAALAFYSKAMPEIEE